ncbi:sensor domain-containing diguanylate cyclase [Vibrio taketomensis]|uniref:sensor domain-containing diguanylate cyclase n=1 Tax=Vibrio taketomensis TaxID=2572923 RepID=UPI0013896D2F|nr:sensor domain-containing diguanylate cyclase [Vibrio taketomensis]
MSSVRIAVLIISVFSLLNLAHYYMNLKEFQKNITESTLLRSTQYINNSLQDLNRTYAQASRLVADVYAYKIQRQYSIEEMLAELQETQRELFVKTVGLVDIENNLYLDNFGRNLRINVTTERDKWVQEFVDLPQDYRYNFYDPDIIEYDTLYSFYHDHKIRDENDHVIGILGIGLDYETFYHKIQGLDDDVNVSFLTQQGEVRLPKTLKGKSIFTLYPNITQDQVQLTKDESRIVWRHEDGNTFLLYFHYLNDINRVLLLEMDVTDYYEQSKIQHFYSFLLGLGLTIIAVIINLLISVYQSNKLTHSAFFDSLTQCRNRNYIESQIKKASNWHCIAQSGYSLITFDIDHFKCINDNYGHAKGDEVLKQVANIAKHCLRDNDEFIRLGGDEFLILLNMDAQSATDIAKRINQNVSQHTMVSLSIGITDILEHDSFDSALERADSALYVAKGNGRNQIQIR